MPPAEVLPPYLVDKGVSADQVLPSLSHVARSSFRTLADPVRLPPVVSVPDSGLPRRALPRVPGTTDPVRHPAGPACPSRGSCRVHGTDGASRVATPSIFRMPASAETGRCFVALFPARHGLPLMTGGSASALSVSRPARRSLAFRPAWSLSRPGRPFSPRLQSMSRTSMNRSGRYQPEPVAGWDSHPPGKRAFPVPHVELHLVVNAVDLSARHGPALLRSWGKTPNVSEAAINLRLAHLIVAASSS